MRIELDEIGLRLETAREDLSSALADARQATIRARSQGWTLDRIAGRLGVTRKTVTDWLDQDAKG